MQRLADFAFFPHDAAAANRARLRHAKQLAMRALHLDANHFRNHIAASLHHYRVADLQAQPRDLVFVVKRRPRHRNAAHHLRRQMRNRRQRARSPHLHRDIDDFGLYLPRRIFERDGPARRLRGEPQPPLLRDAVDFEHDAIDLIRQSFALRFPFAAEFQRLFDVVAQAALGIDFEAVDGSAIRAIPNGCRK